MKPESERETETRDSDSRTKTEQKKNMTEGRWANSRTGAMGTGSIPKRSEDWPNLPHGLEHTFYRDYTKSITTRIEQAF